MLFDCGHGQGTGWFHDASGVNKHILDGRTHGIGVHGDETVHQAFGHAEGLFPDEFHGCAIRKQSHVRQSNPGPCFHGLNHGIGVVHLHPDHPDVRANGFDVVGDTRNQPATTNGHKHRIKAC